MHNLIESFYWLSSQKKKKKVCLVHRQGKKCRQKYETERLVKFRNHLHALTMVGKRLIFEAHGRGPLNIQIFFINVFRSKEKNKQK